MRGEFIPKIMSKTKVFVKYDRVKTELIFFSQAAYDSKKVVKNS